jgi:hypothetical protein
VSALDELGEAGEALAPELRERVLAMGDAAVSGLVDVLKGEGWSAVHAAELLGELRPASAIGPMLDVLVATEANTHVHARIVQAMPRFGAAALEPTLARLDATDDEETQIDLTNILARLGVRDDRIFDAILEVFALIPSFGAADLAAYGDPAGLEVIEEALRALEPDAKNPIWRLQLIELQDAHAALGGTMSDELRAHVDRLREEARRDGVVRAGPKVGRNDPCPCGSGKKYKKCCIGKAIDPRIKSEEQAKGYTDDFLAFAQPLVDASPKDEKTHALAVAQALWDLAHVKDDAARESMLASFLSALPPFERSTFEPLARQMIDSRRTARLDA